MTPRRAALVLLGWALMVSAVAALILGQTGAEPSGFPGLPDPGNLTRWGLPVARSLRDLSAATTIGLLFLAAVLIPYDDRARRQLKSASARAVRTAGWSASVWLAAGLVVLLFTYSDLAGVPVYADGYLTGLPEFARTNELGRSLGLSAILTAGVVAGCFLGTRSPATGTDGIAVAITLLAAAALWPLALTGHAADSANHGTAVILLFAHLAAVSVWVGGLAAFGLLQADLGRHREQVLRRFSITVACCFALVAFSGVLSAILRLNRWEDLRSAYGILIVMKAAALGLLGVAGYLHRRALLSKTPTWTAPARRQFARLAVTELIIMGIAVGMGVALGRTPPPQPSARSPQPASQPAAAVGTNNLFLRSRVSNRSCTAGARRSGTACTREPSSAPRPTKAMRGPAARPAVHPLFSPHPRLPTQRDDSASPPRS